MFRALKIKVTGEETEIHQKKDFDFSDYERELGAVETLNNFPAIYKGKTAMIITNKINTDKSININDKASGYYQKFLDQKETSETKKSIPDLPKLQNAYPVFRGLYIRGDCILVLESSQTGGHNA